MAFHLTERSYLLPYTLYLYLIMKIQNSPVTQHQFNGVDFYLKRDDKLHPQFSGNKARKFMGLLDGDFPSITTIIGYGSPQANSLYSLAALAQLKGWQLDFYVDHIPSFLQENPKGNYRAALDLGANIIALNDTENAKLDNGSTLGSFDYIQQVRQPKKHELFVPEGGRCGLAESGVKQLAIELIEWKKEQKLSSLTVALPSGTGTTALFLHKHLKAHDIKVIICACVGGNSYLTEQFLELGETDHPEILTPTKKHHFGKLYRHDYEMWKTLLLQTDVEFELLYDPLMWRCLSDWLPNNTNQTLLYIHQGGLLGNESMLPRYQRKFD